MLNSTEHDTSTAHKKYRQMNNSLALSLSDVVFSMLISVIMTISVGILTFMSRINFVLSSVEHEKSFITSGQGNVTITENTPAFIRRNLI